LGRSRASGNKRSCAKSCKPTIFHNTRAQRLLSPMQ
jgi:hypothetical protein